MATFDAIKRAFNYLAEVGIPAPAPKSERPEDIQDDVTRMIRAWELTFDDVGDEELYAATVMYAKEGTFWPKPADIRKHCPSVQRKQIKQDAAHKEEGINYWPRILTACGSIGPATDWHVRLAKQLGIPDEATRLRDAVVAAAGSWKALRLADHDATRYSMGQRFNAAWARQEESRRIHQIDLVTEARKRISQRGALGVNNGK